ncbi:uncharacterized protein ABDE67_009849 isoform 1-T2 [Symphorus nematophorus]
MDRTVLLVLLCLQVFLLITAFTSIDATTVWRDDQQQQSPYLEEEIHVNPREPSGRRGIFRKCGYRPGGLPGQPGQPERPEVEEISVNPSGTSARRGIFRNPSHWPGVLGLGPPPDQGMPEQPALEKDTGVKEVEEVSVHPRGTSARRGIFRNSSHRPGAAGVAGQSDQGMTTYNRAHQW